MSKKLYVLAPNDRFNYGDLIFPHILNYYFKEKFDEIIFCSTSFSDLSTRGGIPTVNFRVLYRTKEQDNNFLVVAGGDSLCIKWDMIISFIDIKYNYLSSFLYKVLKKKSQKLLYFYIRLKYKPKTLFPFSIGKCELSNFSGVLYNSLGGSCLENDKKILNDKRVKKILDSVDYISVRDNKTNFFLNLIGVKSFVRADSAILMSEIFSEDYLYSKITYIPSTLKDEKYIYFQINKKEYFNNEKFYVEILRKIYVKYKLKICLCPIGTVFGHEDQIALLNISNFLDKKSYVLIKSPSIWDIMWLIKNSILYVGTSLHGAITAMSFGVPIVAHGPNKLKNYIDTWYKLNRNVFVEKKYLYSLIESQLVHPEICSIENQKQSILDSFKKMGEIIDNNLK